MDISGLSDITYPAAVLAGSLKLLDIIKPITDVVVEDVRNRIDVALWKRGGREAHFASREIAAQKLTDGVTARTALSGNESNDLDERLRVKTLFEFSQGIEEDDLIDLFSSLLSSAMDAKTSSKVLPAFASVISDMSSLDAMIVNNPALFDGDNPVLLARAIPKDESLKGLTDYQMYKPWLAKDGFDVQSNIIIPPSLPKGRHFSITDTAISLSNLERMQLIQIKYDAAINSDDIYKNIWIRAALEGPSMFGEYAESHYLKAFIQGIIRPTNFGKRFYEVCVAPTVRLKEQILAQEALQDRQRTNEEVPPKEH